MVNSARLGTVRMRIADLQDHLVGCQELREIYSVSPNDADFEQVPQLDQQIATLKIRIEGLQTHAQKLEAAARRTEA